jgi:hypothetical protein
MHKVSYKTRFISKEPKLEPKLVMTLSETKRLVRWIHKIAKQVVLEFWLNQN